MRKILSPQTIAKKCRLLKQQGKVIAMTNGCFDLLHLGHISYLQKAKKKDRILVLALNSDKSVRTIKGSQRPIVPEDQRAEVMAALECVDFVTFFDDPTPEKVIRTISPDVLIKGADWKGQEIAGGEYVKSQGGKVEFIHFVKGLSTSKLIETILKKCKTSRKKSGG